MTLRLILLITTLMMSGLCSSMNVSFNQAWFKNNYGHQYLDSSFNKAEVERIFRLAKQAGSTDLRLWFFESADFQMLNWKDNKIVGIKPEFIKNVVETLRIAKDHDLKIYMTLLDGQAYRPATLKFRTMMNLRSIYNKKGGELFLKLAVQPLLQEIDDEGLTSVISRIDLSNELDSVLFLFAFNSGWVGAKNMLCQWSNKIKKIGSFKNVPISFSLRLHPLVPLPKNMFKPDGLMACADFFDFHSYHDEGEIHKCEYFKTFSQTSKKPLILGEFGQSYFNNAYDETLHAKNTSNYIQNAKDCGFQQAFAWRLSDVRPGRNAEARYSFEAYGEPRPSYNIIQNYNLKNP